MPIPKVGQEPSRFERPTLMYPNARTAFGAFLRRTVRPGERVLLPAYIGWSPREGSGVFDPIEGVGAVPAFYRVDESLHLDLADLETQLRRGSRVFVLIHYFGHVDPSYAQAVALARKYGAHVVEDEAHAMFTDLYGGSCGRLGDVCLFSLHKLLPVPRGGALVVNPSGRALCDGLRGESDGDLWRFDLLPLMRARREDAALLANLIEPLRGRIRPLWTFTSDEVPQTYPIVIEANISRDTLYEKMNAAGYGVVSLYHTMIAAIRPDEFPVSHRLAKVVMNLPTHQEASESDLRAMIHHLDHLLS